MTFSWSLYVPLAHLLIPSNPICLKIASPQFLCTNPSPHFTLVSRIIFELGLPRLCSLPSCSTHSWCCHSICLKKRQQQQQLRFICVVCLISSRARSPARSQGGRPRPSFPFPSLSSPLLSLSLSECNIISNFVLLVISHNGPKIGL